MDEIEVNGQVVTESEVEEMVEAVILQASNIEALDLEIAHLREILETKDEEISRLREQLGEERDG
jgi:hypothetical protein